MRDVIETIRFDHRSVDEITSRFACIVSKVSSTIYFKCFASITVVGEATLRHFPIFPAIPNKNELISFTRVYRMTRKMKMRFVRFFCTSSSVWCVFSIHTSQLIRFSMWNSILAVKRDRHNHDEGDDGEEREKKKWYVLCSELNASQQKHNTQSADWMILCILFAVFGFWVNRVWYFFSSSFRFVLYAASILCAHFYVFDSNELNREEIIIFYKCIIAIMHISCWYSLLCVLCVSIYEFPFFVFFVSFSVLFCIVQRFVWQTVLCRNSLRLHWMAFHCCWKYFVRFNWASRPLSIKTQLAKSPPKHINAERFLTNWLVCKLAATMMEIMKIIARKNRSTLFCVTYIHFPTDNAWAHAVCGVQRQVYVWGRRRLA